MDKLAPIKGVTYLHSLDWKSKSQSRRKPSFKPIPSREAALKSPTSDTLFINPRTPPAPLLPPKRGRGGICHDSARDPGRSGQSSQATVHQQSKGDAVPSTMDQQRPVPPSKSSPNFSRLDPTGTATTQIDSANVVRANTFEYHTLARDLPGNGSHSTESSSTRRGDRGVLGLGILGTDQDTKAHLNNGCSQRHGSGRLTQSDESNLAGTTPQPLTRGARGKSLFRCASADKTPSMDKSIISYPLEIQEQEPVSMWASRAMLDLKETQESVRVAKPTYLARLKGFGRSSDHLDRPSPRLDQACGKSSPRSFGRNQASRASPATHSSTTLKAGHSPLSRRSFETEISVTTAIWHSPATSRNPMFSKPLVFAPSRRSSTTVVPLNDFESPAAVAAGVNPVEPQRRSTVDSGTAVSSQSELTSCWYDSSDDEGDSEAEGGMPSRGSLRSLKQRRKSRGEHGTGRSLHRLIERFSRKKESSSAVNAHHLRTTSAAGSRISSWTIRSAFEGDRNPVNNRAIKALVAAKLADDTFLAAGGRRGGGYEPQARSGRDNGTHPLGIQSTKRTRPAQGAGEGWGQYWPGKEKKAITRSRLSKWWSRMACGPNK